MDNVDRSSDTSPSLTTPCVGKPCLFVFNFSLDIELILAPRWCRALVEAVSSENNSVSLIDFGKIVSIKISSFSIRKMIVELSRLRPMTATVHAPSVIPVEGSTWSVEVLRFVKDYVRGIVFILMVGGDLTL